MDGSQNNEIAYLNMLLTFNIVRDTFSYRGLKTCFAFYYIFMPCYYFIIVFHVQQRYDAAYSIQVYQEMI